MYVRRLSFKPGTSVTSPPTTRRSKSNRGSSTSAMVSAPKHGNTPMSGAKMSRNVNAHSNSVSETGTDNASCAALTPNTTSGSPFQNTERSISTAPSFTVSYTFTPSIFAGTDPNENVSKRNAVRKLGRVAVKMGSSVLTMTSDVATSRYGHAAASTLLTQPPLSTSRNASHAGSSPMRSWISDSSRVLRSANAALDAARAFFFSFALTRHPKKKPLAAAPAPKPRTAAPNSPSRGLTKFSAAAARSFCGDVPVSVRRTSVFSSSAVDGSAFASTRAPSLPTETFATLTNDADASSLAANESSTMGRRSRFCAATAFASRDATAGSAAAPEARTADATHANAAARARSVHVSRSPSGRRGAEARLVDSASARARKPRLDPARDATRRREARRRAPTAPEGARAWGTAHAAIASEARRERADPADASPTRARRHALRARIPIALLFSVPRERNTSQQRPLRARPKTRRSRDWIFSIGTIFPMRENIRERGGLNGGDLIEFSRDYPRGARHQTESRVRRAKPTAPSTEPPTGHATRTGNSRIQILPTRLLRVFVPSSAATTARRRAPRAHKRTRGARESAPRPGTTSEGRYLPSLFAVVSTPPGVCPARGDHRTRISRGLRVRRKTRQHERFSSPRRLEASARVPRARPRATRTAAARV